MAAQFTATKGRDLRAPLACTAFAKYSLPEPVSPVTKRLMGELTSSATRAICRSSAGSPSESAASGAGSLLATAARATTAAGGGGVADRNSRRRTPANISARWSLG